MNNDALFVLSLTNTRKFMLSYEPHRGMNQNLLPTSENIIRNKGERERERERERDIPFEELVQVQF